MEEEEILDIVNISELPQWLIDAYDYYPHMSIDLIEPIEPIDINNLINGDPLDGLPF